MYPYDSRMYQDMYQYENTFCLCSRMYQDMYQYENTFCLCSRMYQDMYQYDSHMYQNNTSCYKNAVIPDATWYKMLHDAIWYKMLHGAPCLYRQNVFSL